jgi:hypothetical protein
MTNIIELVDKLCLAARKGRNSLEANLLGDIKTEALRLSIAAKRKGATEADYKKAIQSYISSLKNAISMVDGANDSDTKDTFIQECAAKIYILENKLMSVFPALYSRDQIFDIVFGIFESGKCSMKEVMPILKSREDIDLIDMKLASEIVKELIANGSQKPVVTK